MTRVLDHRHATVSRPQLPSPIREILRRGPAGWSRPSVMVVDGDGFAFLGPGPTENQIRELLGDAGRTLFQGSAGRSGEHLEVLCPENPPASAPVQYVDFEGGTFSVQGPVAIVARTPSGFSTVFTPDMLEAIRLENREGVPTPVLTVRRIPAAVIAHRDERSFRRVKVILSLVVVFAGWWVWRSTSLERPQSLEGTWGFAELSTNGWQRSDTLQLLATGLAVRTGRAIWHGQPSEIGRELGVDLNDLDLSGLYTWGIRRPPFRPVELCLRARGDSPAMGCAPLQIRAGELIWGKASFVRQ
jgi:hypothetical protein